MELFLERPHLAEALRAGLRRLPDLERALGHLRAVAAPPPVAALPLYVLEQVQAKRIQALGTAGLEGGHGAKEGPLLVRSFCGLCRRICGPVAIRADSGRPSRAIRVRI